MSRVIFDVIVFVSMLVFPFSVTLVLLVIGMLTFPRFWELVAFVLVSDLLYRGALESRIFWTDIPLVYIALVAYLATEYLRSILRTRHV